MRASSIHLTGSQIEQLIELARKSLPLESCAVLLGRFHEKSVRDAKMQDPKDLQHVISVVEILPQKNEDASPYSFSIDPQNLLDAYIQAQSRSLEVVGYFHSHPSAPYPSAKDKEFMELNPVVWVIYSTLASQMKAFVIAEDNTITEVTVRNHVT